MGRWHFSKLIEPECKMFTIYFWPLLLTFDSYWTPNRHKILIEINRVQIHYIKLSKALPKVRFHWDDMGILKKARHYRDGKG